MKILLQSKLTKYFFGGTNEWEADWRRGLDFKSVGDAIRFADRRCIFDAHVLVKFGTHFSEMRVPLSNEPDYAFREKYKPDSACTGAICSDLPGAAKSWPCRQ